MNCQLKNRETGQVIDLGECRDEYECSLRALEYVNRQARKEGDA